MLKYSRKILIFFVFIQVLVSNSLAETMFSETFEGAFPGDNGWSVGDLTSDPLNVGYDYWDDTSYKSYNGGWSGWSAQIGNQLVTSTVTETIFTEGFEGAWPGSWTVYDDSSWWGGSDYWGDTTYRSYERSWSGWIADEGYDFWGRRNSDLHLYDNYMDAYMYRPVNLNDYNSVTLSYRYWIKSEEKYDYLEVIYYDGGKWNYIKRKTGNSYGWQEESASIPKTATYVGFYFHSDYLVVDEGAYLDKIRLEGTKATHVPNSDLHQYDDYMDAYMQKQINLAGYKSATLSYKYWLDVEDYYDWLKVQTSSDGSNWIDKKTYSDGYDSKDGDSKARQWYSDSIDLTSYAGSNVYIRFLFHSDYLYHDREGAYLDDIKVELLIQVYAQPMLAQ